MLRCGWPASLAVQAANRRRSRINRFCQRDAGGDRAGNKKYGSSL